MMAGAVRRAVGRAASLVSGTGQAAAACGDDIGCAGLCRSFKTASGAASEEVAVACGGSIACAVLCMSTGRSGLKAGPGMWHMGCGWNGGGTGYMGAKGAGRNVGGPKAGAMGPAHVGGPGTGYGPGGGGYIGTGNTGHEEGDSTRCSGASTEGSAWMSRKGKALVAVADDWRILPRKAATALLQKHHQDKEQRLDCFKQLINA